MRDIAANARRSLIRSQVRKRVLRATLRLGGAYPSEVARAARIDVGRLDMALYGHRPKYRPELGLVPLGLVRERRTPLGRILEVTKEGRREARG